MKINMAKILQDLGRIETSIANKTLLGSSPPLSPGLSTLKVQDPYRALGEARECPKPETLWKEVEEQSGESHQLSMIRENVPSR